MNIPMPLTSLDDEDDELARGLDGGFGASLLVMVDVEDERLKVLARGARCVSFSSGVAVSTRDRRTKQRWRFDHNILLVNFQDMVTTGGMRLLLLWSWMLMGRKWAESWVGGGCDVGGCTARVSGYAGEVKIRVSVRCAQRWMRMDKVIINCDPGTPCWTYVAESTRAK